MQRAGVAYRRLLDYQKERGYANDTQLGVGKDGNQRTLYSLRHTAYGIRHTAYGIRHTAYGNHLSALVRWGHQLALVGAQCEEERDDD
jgi:hypothetical protein